MKTLSLCPSSLESSCGDLLGESWEPRRFARLSVFTNRMVGCPVVSRPSGERLSRRFVAISRRASKDDADDEEEGECDPLQ